MRISLKKFSIIALSVLIALGTISPVLAKEEMEIRKLERKEVKVQIKQKLEVKQQQQVKRWLSNKIRVFYQAISQINKRIAKLTQITAYQKSTGKDVAQVEILLATARTNVVSAQGELVKVTTSIDSTIASSTPKIGLEAINAEFTNAKEYIKAAHTATVQATALLKGVGFGKPRNTTTTPVTSTTTATTTGTTTATTTNQ